MINGVTLKIRMSRSKDKFVLIGTENVEYMVEILSAKLLMRKLKIAPSLALAREKMMTKNNVKYPVTRVTLIPNKMTQWYLN